MATQPDMLQDEIARRTGQGWVLVSRDAAEAQMRKPKRFSILWFLAWAILSVGTLFWVYLIWHWAKSDQLTFLRVVEGQLVVTGGGRGAFGALFAPLGAWWRWAGERPSTQGKVFAYGGPVAAIVILIIIISVAASGGGEADSDGDGEQVARQPTEASEATQPPKLSWETGPVTEATVREAVDDLDNLGLVRPDIDPGNVTFLSVIPHWETDGYIVAIEFEPGTVWSETDMLTVAGESTLVTMAKLFANAAVDRVKISAMAELTDALGNTSTEFVTTATINRATADQINWQGFADRQLMDNKHIFCFADEFIIRPVIYNELGDIGCLPGPSRSEG